MTLLCDRQCDAQGGRIEHTQDSDVERGGAARRCSGADSNSQAATRQVDHEVRCHFARPDVDRTQLIDEFHFSIYPVIAEGARIFDGFDTSRMHLELISTRRYASGVVEVSYRPRWL